MLYSRLLGPVIRKSTIKAMVLILAAEQERKGRTKRRLNFCFCSNYLLAGCEWNMSSTGAAVCSSPAPDWELVKDPVSPERPTQLSSTSVTRTIEASSLWFGFYCFSLSCQNRWVELTCCCCCWADDTWKLRPWCSAFSCVRLFTQRNKSNLFDKKNACGFCLEENVILLISFFFFFF